MTDATAAPERYHAFDALRAVMMLLGVLLHACQFYLPDPLFPGFDFRDTRTSAACGLAFFSIHAFRMQVFFAMAGFFAALLCERRGVRGMWSNRMRRVGLPLVVGWLILFPITISAFLYGCARHEGVPAWEAVRGWWTSGQIPWIDDWNPLYSLFLVTPLHLWFLYALIWLYMAAVVSRWVGGRGGGAVGRAASRLFRGLAARHLLLPASIGLSVLTVLPNPSGLFAQEFPLFLPNPLVMLAYGPFFGFGWMLYRNLDLLPVLARRPALTLAAAAGVLVLYFRVLESAFTEEGRNAMRLATAASGSAVAWLCTFGFIGLSLRLFGRPSPAMRYVSDSAYWVYLAHLPLIYWMQGLLFDLPAPALVKAAIILLASTSLLLLSYDLVVRPGFVGRFLNGRTYPSVLLGRRDRRALDGGALAGAGGVPVPSEAGGPG
ncbi:acyltransferase family protein [Tautonia plasticadhaerens]|uniref:Glucans biosynthesis protein C n=1 Tax=Tautonia plasticadhaerens TaxID=2527974 RepID=A0A518GV38_9BACT|nr:acyltransferase family protein [Tautonia plasticadhaerens]QDV32449.1 Glucans biosynthesis protein C [Tautonia plasticadhaerens]